MAAAAPELPLKRGPRPRSRFNIACDGMYLLESGTSVGEILGVDADGDTHTCAAAPGRTPGSTARNWTFPAATTPSRLLCKRQSEKRTYGQQSGRCMFSTEYYLQKTVRQFPPKPRF